MTMPARPRKDEHFTIADNDLHHNHHHFSFKPCRMQDRARSARRESGTLIEHSRRKFQTFIAHDNPPTPAGPRVPKLQIALRPNTTGGRGDEAKPPLTPTNGPTKDGSILYNNKPSLLNSLRARPKSEQPGRFDHLRGTNAHHPDIQRTLEQSNCEYRVGLSPCHTARSEPTQNTPDFVILIPVTSQASDVTVDGDEDGSVGSVEWRTGPDWIDVKGSRERKVRSKTRSRTPMSDRSRVKDTVEVVEGDPRGSGTEHQSPNTSTLEVPVVNLTHTPPEDTSQEPDPDPDPTLQPPLSRGNSPKPQTSSSLLAVPGMKKRPPSSRKKTSGSRPSSARSDTSSVVSIPCRPHCWVDDVTISSDDSMAERDFAIQEDLRDNASVRNGSPGGRSHARGLSPNPSQRGNSPTTGDRKKVVLIPNRVNSSALRRTPSAGRGNKQVKQSTASVSKGGVKVRTEQGLGVVVEGREPEVTLPRFLCPSSETKSRQAAIKEWLAKTSFSTACRTVPLV